jgi:translation initiation factor 4E
MYELSNNYNIWYHHCKDDWSIGGYKHIYSINNGVDFWKLYNNWDLIGGLLCKQFFIMKTGVKPIWEDEINKKGGCWSFKIFENQANELWEDLSILFVTDNLLSNSDECVGLSICLKKNSYCVIKIWNTNNKNNSIKNINNHILKKWGTDLIYISHNSDV